MAAVAAEIGIAGEIDAELLADTGVVVAPGQLHIAAALVARAVAGLRVAEISSRSAKADRRGRTACRRARVVFALAFGNGAEARGLGADRAQRHQQHLPVVEVELAQSRLDEGKVGFDIAARRLREHRRHLADGDAAQIIAGRRRGGRSRRGRQILARHEAAQRIVGDDDDLDPIALAADLARQSPFRISADDRRARRRAASKVYIVTRHNKLVAGRHLPIPLAIRPNLYRKLSLFNRKT